MRVDVIEAAQACRLIGEWAASSPQAGSRGRYVCAANVHMTMESRDRPDFASVVNAADLVLADGQPMVWALRALGLPQERRVRVSPDLLLELFERCERDRVRVGLYGGTPETLRHMTHFLATRYPEMPVVCAISPPFREAMPQEDERDSALIEASGAQLLLVGIGCPKQERWMAAHRERLSCVMFGVGAAFDLLGGRTRNAPRWTRDVGLEWVYRLLLEPRRLWRRYLYNNPRFTVLFLAQLIAVRRAGSAA
jgi:N-acetylglucosaminyldiphosphoundecaprenol N-acetyl-beta-D-mannosaminyltransferase